MASKTIILPEDCTKLDDAKLDQRITYKLGEDLAHRVVEAREEFKRALTLTRAGGNNAVQLIIPLPPAKGAVIGSRYSKAFV